MNLILNVDNSQDRYRTVNNSAPLLYQEIQVFFLVMYEESYKNDNLNRILSFVI